MANRFGLTGADVIVDLFGNVQTSTATVHATEADATGNTNVLATVTITAGRWTYSDATRTKVWLRLVDGTTWPVVSFDTLEANLDTDVAALVGTTSGTRTALTAAYAGRSGNRMVWLGDSITAWGDGRAATNAPTSTVSHTLRVSLGNLASILSSQRANYVVNAGVPGDTAAMMLARFDTDVTPYTPNVVHVLAGTNDVGLSVPLATTGANITALVAKIRGIGARPILSTIPPRGSAATPVNKAQTTALNAWIKRYAATEGISVVDYYSVLADPASGGYLAAYQNDGVHPNDAGFVAIAQKFVDTVAATLPAWEPPLAEDNTDPNNLITNGLFINTTSGVPTSYSNATPITGETVTIVTGDTAIKGNWYKRDCVGTSAAKESYQYSATNAIPGHRYMFAGRIKSSWSSGANGFTVKLRIFTSGSVDMMPINMMACTIANGIFYTEYTAPAGSASQSVSFNIDPGTMMLQVAQVTLYDLTAMGLA